MFVFGSGLRLGVGSVNPASPGWGLGWVCLGTVCGVFPLVSAVCGDRGWASVSACLWDVCGFVRAPLAPRRFQFWRAVWACVLGPGLGCAPPFLAGLSGGVFCAFVFLPPPLSCKNLVQMDLKLKPEFEKTRVRRRPYPAPQEQVEEIERQIQECIDAGLVEEYKKGDYPRLCSPCFLVAKPGSTAL